MTRSLEERMDARQIVMQTGMSARPEYYSGRDAMVCDLNGNMLERIHKTVQREHGDEAANHFAQMVADIPKLTATDFLLNLYGLEGHDWKWEKGILGNEKGIYVDGETDEKRNVSGLATVYIALGNSDNSRDETASIRTDFLKRHGIETPKLKSIFSEII